MSELDSLYESLKTDAQGTQDARWNAKISSAFEQDPDHPGIRALWGNHLLWKGRLEEATELIESAATNDSEDSQVLAYLGNLNAYLNRTEKAMDLYRRSLEIDSNNYTALLNYPFLLQKQGQVDECNRLLDHLKQSYPQNGRAIAVRSYIPLAKANYSEVRAILAEYSGPENDNICLAQARLALREGEWNLSEQLARRATQLNPEYSSAWEHLCMLLVHQGRLVEAKEAGEYAIGINPRSAVALKELSKIAKRLGDKDLAKEYEARAASAIPFLSEMQSTGKDMLKLLHTGDKRALRELMHNAEHASGEVQGNAVLGLCLYFESHLDAKEIPDFLSIAKRHEVRQASVASLEFSWLLNSAKLAEAEAVLTQMKIAHPGDALPRIAELRLLIAKGELDQAKQLAIAIERDGLNDPHLYYRVIIPLLDADLKEEAGAFLNQLVKKFPQSDAAQQAQMVVSLSNGDIERGLEIFRNQAKVNEFNPKAGCLKLLVKLPVVMARLVLIKLGIIKRRRP